MIAICLSVLRLFAINSHWNKCNTTIKDCQHLFHADTDSVCSFSAWDFMFSRTRGYSQSEGNPIEITGDTKSGNSIFSVLRWAEYRIRNSLRSSLNFQAGPFIDPSLNLSMVGSSGCIKFSPALFQWYQRFSRRCCNSIARPSKWLRACLRSPEQQPEEGQVDHLQAGIELAFAVLP